jgi:predicted secreted Zn-dependent protease
MPNNEVTSQKENTVYEVITYTDNVAFNYTLPDKEETQTIEQELTLIWEDTLEKFIEEHGTDREYKVHSFKREREQKFFIERIEGEIEDLIEEVQEEIANKMKFGFEFTGQLHNDD